jgi:F0F1-type ATP synthase membrane subunit a
MPSGDYIQNALTASWRMMWGRREAIRMHDLSADGFWTSFFAIVVALPPLVVGWVAVADQLTMFPQGVGSRFATVLRLAIVDIAAWVVPIAMLAAVSPYAGIQKRFVHYVVAANWGHAIAVWIMLPPALNRLFARETGDLVTLLSVALFVFTLVLIWAAYQWGVSAGAGVPGVVFGQLERQQRG